MAKKEGNKPFAIALSVEKEDDDSGVPGDVYTARKVTGLNIKLSDYGV